MINDLDVNKDMEVEMVKRTMTASEALFGFCGWLTSRKEKTVMSSTDEAGTAVELIEKFMDANNLPMPTDGWEKNLVHPD